jgi:D-glycero-D-manno-heptose 1,7-bisphosphate phosphatase
MKLIILDRDGVINEDSDEYIKSVDEWVPIPGSLEAIARLNQAGYHVVVATNQSGIARGYYDLTNLNAMHQKMHKLLAKLGGHVDGILFCPHAPEDTCDCRKPKTGMFEDIARRWGISLKGVPIVGDSRRDLEAAVSMGATPILVKTGKGKRTMSDLSGLGNVEIYNDLAHVVGGLVDA